MFQTANETKKWQLSIMISEGFLNLMIEISKNLYQSKNNL